MSKQDFLREMCDQPATKTGNERTIILYEDVEQIE